MRIIVGVTGASGAILAKRFLEELKKLDAEIHLVVSENAKLVIDEELKGKGLDKLANFTYDHKDFRAKIASGSFKTDGMVVIPCSMKTLAAIANGYSSDLICRAADVCLKEERKLILVPRESPLNLIHLRNMVTAKEAGAVIIPPVLSFYNNPNSVDDTIDYVVGKVFDSLGLDNKLYKRWGK